MNTINQTKQLAESDTPVLFFECTLPSGDVERWSTHGITLGGQNYSARVLRHDVFDLQLSYDDAMDGISQLSLQLANADSELSQLNAVIGFKGSQLTVYFAFVDLSSGEVTTETTVLFRGIAGDPDEITEATLTLTFTNKLSLQRVPVPDVRVQRACPWTFPTTIDERAEAVSGGIYGKYSRFYRCGYSADAPGGIGNLNGTTPYVSCDKTRAQCEQRGMFSTDGSGNSTKRFGGLDFVPSAVLVRTTGDKSSHLSPLLDNSAKYNDAVPLIYGTGWLKAPVVFARNDGNLTHLEVLLGMGELSNILKVVVNDVEIPIAVQGTNMTATGWYSVITLGSKTGSFNLDFTDTDGKPMGDPYGNMGALSVVVPNRVSSGTTLPNVQVLLQGTKLDSYNLDGSFALTSYTNNPAWVILDVLRRCGWSLAELDISSFAQSADFCAELIKTRDLNGNPVQVPRFQCNAIVTKRQSAATFVRGVRVGSSLMLRYGASGQLQLLPEANLATQQPALPNGSNSVEPLNGGWPAYEFSDSSGPFSGIARDVHGASTVRISSRHIAETSNRVSVEFQDESNEYQQDSLSVVREDDVALIGYEITSQSTGLGIANFTQANRVLLRQLDKSIEGNQFVQFVTSFRALKIRPGDIIAVTYVREGFERRPLRVVRLSPSLNYQLVTVLAQIHDDDWYSDDPAVLGGAGRQPKSTTGIPRPLLGVNAHRDASGKLEGFDFAVSEVVQSHQDGSATDVLTVQFFVPSRPAANAPGLPLVSLSPGITTIDGTLSGGQTLYYAVSATNTNGVEGALSFTIPAALPSHTNTNAVTLNGLSFPISATAFNVYRGATPQTLYQIASAQPISGSFEDAGLSARPVGPPDASFDHANFYCRNEYAGPVFATSFSATTIGSSDFGAAARAYTGMVVRIIEGRGRGQERAIATNTEQVITVASPWAIVPDATSVFVVAESSWRFAAVSALNPAQFEVPFRRDTVLQISGRAANVLNQEADPDLCPLSRWALGGTAVDGGVPPSPVFQISTPGRGEVAIYQVGFPSEANLASITSGTLQLFYWNELNGTSLYELSSPVDNLGTTISLSSLPAVPQPGIIQIDSELMTVLSANSHANTYNVLRGVLGSSAAAHDSGASVLHLANSFAVLPFAQNFFENRASVNYIHTISLPDARLAAAELFVTNAFGDGQANELCFTRAQDGGLRALSGGQFSLQVNGYLATQNNAAPPLVVEASHAVRDIRATINQAPIGYRIQANVKQNGTLYCSVIVPDGETNSGILDGVSLPPLQSGANLSLDLILQPTGTQSGLVSPGRDFTLTIRM